MKTIRTIHRYASADDLDAACQRSGDSWTGARERHELALLRDERRRRSWLRGRMLAKQLIAARSDGSAQTGLDGVDFASIDILSRDERGRSNRPRVWCGGMEQPWSLSISHTETGALAAVCVTDGISTGVDIAELQKLGDGFVRTWFTPAEQCWLQASRSADVAGFIWAAKEALYKACNRGESFDPRRFEVLPSGTCKYGGRALEGCELRSWRVENHVAVLATVRIETSVAVAAD
jgi:4'-phosphopantetheinyl transferase EntD